MHCKSLWIKASAKCINVNVDDAADRLTHLHGIGAYNFPIKPFPDLDSQFGFASSRSS